MNICRDASPRPIESFITNSSEGYNWIKIGDANNGKYIIKTSQKITKESALKSVIVSKGDLIMSNSMSFGKPRILDIDGCIHDGWLAFKFNQELLNKHFLYYLLLSQQNYYESNASGTGVRNLNINRVSNMPLPIPPLAEQKRIVEKTDQLMKLCDELTEGITENERNVGLLMETILKEAFIS